MSWDWRLAHPKACFETLLPKKCCHDTLQPWQAQLQAFLRRHGLQNIDKPQTAKGCFCWSPSIARDVYFWLHKDRIYQRHPEAVSGGSSLQSKVQEGSLIQAPATRLSKVSSYHICILYHMVLIFQQVAMFGLSLFSESFRVAGHSLKHLPCCG